MKRKETLRSRQYAPRSLFATMASNALTLYVKQMTGDYIAVDLNPNSNWLSHDLKHAIQKADRNLPYYYQTILHIDPDTNEPYINPTKYHKDSILLLFMSAADVYIKEQEHFHHYVPGSNEKIESIRYSVHVYHEKQQRDMFSFLVNSKGFHLFGHNQTHDRKPWSEHIHGKELNYVATLEEAVASLPQLIADEIVRKWNSKEIIPCQDRMPYSKARRYQNPHYEEDSDDE